MASPARSSYSDDDYSARYDSDDFASDDDVVSMRQSSHASKPTPKKASPYTIPNRGSKGKTRGRGQNGSKQNTPLPANSVAKRMLSASRIRMNEYRNQIEELNSQIQDLTGENKTLKKMQFRHQKALGKFEEQEGDLPHLLTKHANEVKALREQNRKMKEKFNKTDRYLRDAEDELESVKSQLKKYKNLCNQKGLKERDELYRSVQQSELQIEEKDSRIKELERHIEALNKNHRHEMGIELAHHRETKKQFRLLENKQTDALVALREKEKELEIKNIYSNRLMKASPKHHASYNGTPQHTPPPGRKKRIPSLTDLTSREKVKLYEEKRKLEEKKKLESPRHKSRDIWTDKEEVSKSKKGDNSFENQIETEAEADLWIQREHNRIKLEKEEQDKRMEEQRREKRHQEEMERETRLREEKELEIKLRKTKETEDLVRKRKEEQKEMREQQERIDREHKEREEEERRMKEKKEEEERKQRQEQEKQQRQREAELLEKEAEEERRRLEMNPKMQEERRKKDLLLAKLKQMDGTEKSPSPVNAESPQRATFITSNNAYSPGLDSNYSTKSNYSFTKPTENLHHGLPSHEDVTVPYLEKQRKLKSKKEDKEVGGYQPSFTSNVFNSDNLKAPPVSNKTMISKNNDIHRSTLPATSERKAKLLNDLFGKKTEETNSNDNFGVTEKSRKSSGTKTSSFPWDDPKPVNHSATKRENSSALFAGGSALIEFDEGFDNSASKLLPKRSHHSTTTFSSKPTVNAIDNLDDDIEEVML